MTAPVRWPLHPAPRPGEALSSWLRRLGATYQMSVAELIEHGLGRDRKTVHDLDLDPPLPLLDVPSERSGIDRHRLQQMSLAGWMPATVDSLDRRPAPSKPTCAGTRSFFIRASDRSTPKDHGDRGSREAQ